MRAAIRFIIVVSLVLLGIYLLTIQIF